MITYRYTAIFQAGLIQQNLYPCFKKSILTQKKNLCEAYSECLNLDALLKKMLKSVIKETRRPA